MARLDRAFYERGTLRVARELLGKLLVRQIDGERLSGLIVEVEAYIGERDSACHAARGRTARNAVMYGPAGHAYVYFTYGMHWMLNVVTERDCFPAAVLIRALEPCEGLERQRERRRGRPDHELCSGPARLTQALGIGRPENGADLVEGNADLWIEEAPLKKRMRVERGPRIGINYAQEKDRAAPWRFWIPGSSCVSRPPRRA